MTLMDKSSLRNIDWLRVAVKRGKVYRESILDASHFNRFIRDGRIDDVGVEYEALVLVHALEKGMSRRVLRPFGVEKANRLADILDSGLFGGHENSTILRMSVDVLNAWNKTWSDQGWVWTPSNQRVEACLARIVVPVSGCAAAGTVPVSLVAREAGFLSDSDCTPRKSVRQYASNPVSDEILRECVGRALQVSPSACNRQMVKLWVFDDHRKKDLLFKTLHGTGGVDSHDGARIALVTFDSRSWDFYGERHQGYLNGGLFAMSLIDALHASGVGSCLLQFGNSFREERALLRELGVPSPERAAVAVAFGHPEDGLVPSSVRRSVGEVLRVVG